MTGPTEHPPTPTHQQAFFGTMFLVTKILICRRFIEEEKEKREEKLMLKEAESEFQEIDIAKANQVDPFSKDKVMKIESAAAAKKTSENLKYGEDLMEALEMADEFKIEIE